ncbi:MAG: hypothetical protein WBL21_13710 [Salinimicrobium sp.]
MSSGSIKKSCLFALLLLLFSSCVKDVDLDQYNEIVIPPTAAIDLIYFTLEPDDFADASGNLQKATDFLRLEFLDDDYIQDALIRADFNFVFINSFQQEFVTTFNFVSENNAVQHTVQINVPAGNVGEPAVVNFTEIVPRSQIDAIRKSIKLVVEVEMKANSAPLEGQLQLESKANYKFEFE